MVRSCHVSLHANKLKGLATLPIASLHSPSPSCLPLLSHPIMGMFTFQQSDVGMGIVFAVCRVVCQSGWIRLHCHMRIKIIHNDAHKIPTPYLVQFFENEVAVKNR